MSTLQEDIMFIAGLAVIVIMANAMKGTEDEKTQMLSRM
jgi:hypothetical protein